MTSKNLKIAIVAGESSGDILGAHLIETVNQYHPNTTWFGIGGKLMEGAGCKLHCDLNHLSVMGFWEALPKLKAILSLRRRFITACEAFKPDLFVGIDSPELNLSLAKALKHKGFKTLQYNGPKVWAWRESRLKRMKRDLNKVLTLLPFEGAFYEKKQIPVEFIGHPTADAIPLQPDKRAARIALGISQDEPGPFVALLPGSRVFEVKYLAPHFLKAVQLLHQQTPTLKILVPFANEKIKTQFYKIISTLDLGSLPMVSFIGRSREIMCAADVGLLASGTASLEAMCLKLPMVVAYKLSAFTYHLVKPFVKAKHIAIPNLIAGKTLVPEFIQKEVTAENLANALAHFLNAPDYCDELRQSLLACHQQIRLGANEKAAKAVLALSSCAKSV